MEDAVKMCPLTNGYRSMLVGPESFMSIKKALLCIKQTHLDSRWLDAEELRPKKETERRIIKKRDGFSGAPDCLLPLPRVLGATSCSSASFSSWLSSLGTPVATRLPPWV